MPDEKAEGVSQKTSGQPIELKEDPQNPEIKVGTLPLSIFVAKDGSIFLNREDALDYDKSLG